MASWGHYERAPSLFPPTRKPGIPHHQQKPVDELFQTVDVITTCVFFSKARWNAVPFKVTMRLLPISIVNKGTSVHSNVLLEEK